MAKKNRRPAGFKDIFQVMSVNGVADAIRSIVHTTALADDSVVYTHLQSHQQRHLFVLFQYCEADIGNNFVSLKNFVLMFDYQVLVFVVLVHRTGL